MNGKSLHFNNNIYTNNLYTNMTNEVRTNTNVTKMNNTIISYVNTTNLVKISPGLQAYKQLAIICCFQYKKADDYQDLKKKNVLTDLNKYIYFCEKKLGFDSSKIIILTDIPQLDHHRREKTITISSGSQFEQVLRQSLSLLAEQSFLFFAFSGHGESLDKSCHFVIPTGMGRSHYVSGTKIQQLFYYHLPQSCTCLFLIDTCYSGGLLSLKYKISDTVQINKKYSDMGVNRNITCFHSSSKSELSAVFYENDEHGSVFSHYLLLQLLNHSGNTHYIPDYLDIITKQIYSQRKFSRQPLHHPFVQCTHPQVYYSLPSFPPTTSNNSNSNSNGNSLLSRSSKIISQPMFKGSNNMFREPKYTYSDEDEDDEETAVLI
jgi:hypothetical protein